ncbi:MAG: hypothetical protein SGILL_006257 [Bacillariaceae sp.]
MAPDPEKCDVKGCKVRGQDMKECAAPGCSKFVHLTCFVGIGLQYKNVPKLDGDLVACSKKCATAVKGKDKNAGDTRRSWDHDAKEPNGKTSASILMDWWTTQGKYSKYKGKDNEGKKKKEFAEDLARQMRQETTSTQRTAKQVQSRIKSMADKWRDTYDWTKNTGEGVRKEDQANGTNTFEEAVLKRCPYYYELESIMEDRASVRPLATNYDQRFDLSSVEGNDDEDEDEEEEMNDEQGVQSIMNGLPDTIVIDGDGTEPSEGAAAAPAAAPAPASSAKQKKPRKKKDGSVSDDSLYGGSSLAGVMEKLGDERKKFKKAKFSETRRHNTKMETIQERSLDLNVKQFELQQERAQVEHQQQTLAFKRELMDTYDKYTERGLSHEQMVRLVPELKEIIDAVGES